jgi:hypothetical protein
MSLPCDMIAVYIWSLVEVVLMLMDVTNQGVTWLIKYFQNESTINKDREESTIAIQSSNTMLKDRA